MSAVFVYGLLKPGFSLHHVAEPYVVRSSAGSVRGRLYDAGVPAARFDEDGEIEGYVFWLERDRLAEALRVLDELEDEGDVYKRVTVAVRTERGIVGAQAYEYLGPLDRCRLVGRIWE